MTVQTILTRPGPRRALVGPLALAWASSACSSHGCAGCHIQPIQGGFPKAERFKNGMQLRITKGGLDQIADNLLLVVAWGMIDRAGIRRVIRTSRSDVTAMALTFGATLMLPLDFEVHPGQDHLILRLHGVDLCDLSGVEMLEATVKTYRQLGGDVFLVRPRAPVLEVMRHSGFLGETLGRQNILEQEGAIEYPHGPPLSVIP